MDSFVGRGNQYIQLVKVLYCKLPTNGKQIPAFHLRSGQEPNSDLRGGRRECNYHSVTVVPLPYNHLLNITNVKSTLIF